MNSRLSFLFLYIIIVFFSAGCKGPKGDIGPAGPSISDTSSTKNVYALKFLGSNGYVDIPWSPLLKPTTLTVELWVYVDTLYSEFTPLISATGQDQRTMADGYDVKFESGLFYLRLASASNTAQGYWAQYTPPLKQWIHLACTMDGQTVTLFVNGQQLKQYVDTLKTWYGSSGLTLGMGYHSTFGGYSFFHGMMDEIRIWNYARSASQIQQSMMTKLSGTESGLVGYWNFDNNVLAPLALDNSKYHNHGVIWGDTYLVTTTPF